MEELTATVVNLEIKLQQEKVSAMADGRRKALEEVEIEKEERLKAIDDEEKERKKKYASVGKEMPEKEKEIFVKRRMVIKEEAEKKEKSLKGIIYNVPGKASIEISMNKKTLYKGEAQITQFGTREGLAPIMFEDKKAPVKVYFYPETGAIKQIIQ